MPSWFDIATLSLDSEASTGIRADRAEDQDGILNSAMAVGALITKEVDEGVEARRIVVGGFSQGAALSLVTGLTSERRLAGLVCLSGWLPMSGKMKSVRTGLCWLDKRASRWWGLIGLRDDLTHFQSR
jgi:predicted esterase